jgi:endonuclease/exonuclease/phosphatase family metal-dependent hydrolase
MPNLRVATWNIDRGRREPTGEVDLTAVLAGVRSLDADLLALQEVDQADQAPMIAEALGLGPDQFLWYAPALAGDDSAPAYGNLLLSRLPLEKVQDMPFPADGDDQRSALIATVQVGSRPLTVANTHLSSTEEDNVRQLRELQRRMAALPAPHLLLGDLNLPSAALVEALRRGWKKIGDGPTFPNHQPTEQLDHVLYNDPGGVLRPRGAARVVATPVSDHRALVVDLEVAAP